MTKSTLKKGAFFTDIHFGKKSNSPQHNQDCLNFIQWLIDNVANDPTIDYIAFLGDWYENRSAINISTLNYSHTGAQLLNSVGKPIFFVVGNHDLYHRHTRDIHSIRPFEEFTNFVVIDKPTVLSEKESGIVGGAFFSPYLFHEEYEGLDEYLSIPFWAGHFEFKGFKITGYNVVMATGPEPSKFEGPKRILSGHFHQRQTQGNITYIGNAFPMDFGDAGDYKRGMATYDHVSDTLEFFDWKQCPKYVHVKLSTLQAGKFTIPQGARVKCFLDEVLTHEDSSKLRDDLMKQYNLREMILDETGEIDDLISDTETEVKVDDTVELSDSMTIDQLVVQMLMEIDSDKIDTNLLVQEYNLLS